VERGPTGERRPVLRSRRGREASAEQAGSGAGWPRVPRSV